MRGICLCICLKGTDIMELIGYLLVLVIAVLSIGESVIVKAYANQYENGGMVMNSLIALFAFLFFVVTDIVSTDGFYFPREMIPLGLINCTLYAIGFYSMFVALKVGPYGLSRLISNFSLIFTQCQSISIVATVSGIPSFLKRSIKSRYSCWV